MKYEAPELVVLPTAVDAIQEKPNPSGNEGGKDDSPAYEDWE